VAHAQGAAKTVEQPRRLGKRQVADRQVQDGAVQEGERFMGLFQAVERVFFGLGNVFEEPVDVGMPSSRGCRVPRKSTKRRVQSA
jgi:hypothetical protein